MSASKLDWLLTEFVRETASVTQALVVSGDGLRLATSAGMSETLSDQLSAAASGLVSLARGTARLLDAGPVTQTILEMAGGYLFVTAIAEGATLAVHTERRADLGMVGYEMTMLATRAGHALSPGVRAGTSR
jgi:predicted regulator of Ras-like GTPase activity (Roadblock/LC7/MglB family)